MNVPRKKSSSNGFVITGKKINQIRQIFVNLTVDFSMKSNLTPKKHSDNLTEKIVKTSRLFAEL